MPFTEFSMLPRVDAFKVVPSLAAGEFKINLDAITPAEVNFQQNSFLSPEDDLQNLINPLTWSQPTDFCEEARPTRKRFEEKDDKLPVVIPSHSAIPHGATRSREIEQKKEKAEVLSVTATPTAATPAKVQKREAEPVAPVISSSMSRMLPMLGASPEEKKREEIFDAEAIAKMYELIAKKDRLLASVDVVLSPGVQAVRNNPAQVKSLIEAKTTEWSVEEEEHYIAGRPKLRMYYEALKGKLGSTWVACYGIHSGWLSNAKKNRPDYVAKGIDAAGELSGMVGECIDAVGGDIPGLKIITKPLYALLTAANVRKRNHAVRDYVKYFKSDLETAMRWIKVIARQLTLLQKEMIESIPLTPGGGWKERSKHRLAQIKDWFCADEGDNPVVVQAIDHFELIFAAVLINKDGTFKSPEEDIEKFKALIVANSAATPSPKFFTREGERRADVSREKGSMEEKSSGDTKIDELHALLQLRTEMFEKRLTEVSAQAHQRDEENKKELEKLRRQVRVFDDEEVPTVGSGGGQMQAQLLASVRSTAVGHPLASPLHAGRAAHLEQGMRDLSQKVLVLQDIVNEQAAVIAQVHLPQKRHVA